MLEEAQSVCVVWLEYEWLAQELEREKQLRAHRRWELVVSETSNGQYAVAVLILLFDLRCPPTSRLHNTFDLAVIARRARCAAAARFEGSATRSKVGFEGGFARQLGRILLQVRIKVLNKLVLS
jgi:hypothetical protein